jgi:uncharacterized protein YuzE
MIQSITTTEGTQFPTYCRGYDDGFRACGRLYRRYETSDKYKADARGTYTRISDSAIEKTVRVSDRCLIDIDKYGSSVGIETICTVNSRE